MEAALKSAESSNEELEPYDTRLASRILSLSAQIESLNLELANRRRQDPARAASAWMEREKKEREGWERQREQVEGEAVRMGVEGVRTGAEDVLRWEGLEKAWVQGLRTLEGTRERVGATVGRLERAERAVEYLDEKERVG
jgi:kinetochor protein Mis14/NSL1